MSALVEKNKSWRTVRLGDVAKTSSGGTPKRGVTAFYGGRIPWVKSGELGDSTVYETQEKISQAGLNGSSAKLFPKGTLCIALYGATVGKLGILGMDAATNQAVCGIFLPDEIDTRFAYRFLESKRRELIEMGKGGAQSNISQEIIRNLQFPLPSPDEQRRIVAEIEKQFTRLEAGVAALRRVQASLKRYRAAVLKAACEGPWPQTTVAKVATNVRYGTSAKTNEDANGVPVLRMGNITDGRLSFDKLKFLPASHPEFPDLLLKSGDLLFNRTNSAELVGKTAVYRGTPEPCSFASYLIGVRLGNNYLPTFLSYYLNSVFGRQWIASVVSQQVGQANVNGSKLKDLVIPEEWYHNWCINKGAHAHEFYCMHDHLTLFNNRNVQDFLKEVASLRHFLRVPQRSQA
jgi:type I restriction enzyme S subunit